ncbi:Protein CBG04901 [Caenorhabditis briggsae]|uniref:Protein CBG04901 n=1 Tax=Caenorhabditis briggsae TaxID=6238 RepID=A8WYR6_CAEBR|nr:Protein CBG04901 [Caenorhabditis briggsae]CAP25524.2 Protein CBG04901 [Caenorhabditis briggsae]
MNFAFTTFGPSKLFSSLIVITHESQCLLKIKKATTMKLLILVFLFTVPFIAAIFLEGGGGVRHHGGGGGFSSSSSSSGSSGSSEEHGHHHGHRPPSRPPHRPPRPPHRPPRPPTREQCDDGWLEFQRPNGIWCILVGFSGVTNGWYFQQDAQNTCTGMGPVLTGFQNENERMKVAGVALDKLTALGQTVGGLWVGATNLPGCRVFSCGPNNTFQWTDGETTGTEGFKWGIGEPDNSNWPGDTACIQQFIVAPNYVGMWKPYFVNGDLDKYQCVSQATPPPRFYICGKRGVRR